MEGAGEPVKEYRISTAEEFWDVLSPMKYLFGPGNKPIFRGHANESWKLEPSILRKFQNKYSHPIYSPLPFRGRERSEDRIFAEIDALRIFADYCDSTGLRIPGDSERFRRKYLEPTKVVHSFISHKQIWPACQYFDIMALAQHHRLPTRLLDWTDSSYVAAHFAAADAVRSNSDGRLAVWALDKSEISRLKNVEIIRVPGSNNINVAAQRGVFTLLRQEYSMGKPFEGEHCLDNYIVSCGRSDLARKITLPVVEAPKIIDLCERHGITAATLSPDFYGAAQATIDYLRCWSRSEWIGGRDILAQTLPVSKPSHE